MMTSLPSSPLPSSITLVAEGDSGVPMYMRGGRSADRRRRGYKRLSYPCPAPHAAPHTNSAGASATRARTALCRGCLQLGRGGRGLCVVRQREVDLHRLEIDARDRHAHAARELERAT